MERKSVKRANLAKIDRKSAPTCATCRYLHSTSDEGGDCRRNPPTVIPFNNAISAAFPGVRKADIWCGEYKTAAKG